MTPPSSYSPSQRTFSLLLASALTFASFQTAEALPQTVEPPLPEGRSPRASASPSPTPKGKKLEFEGELFESINPGNPLADLPKAPVGRHQFQLTLVGNQKFSTEELKKAIAEPLKNLQETGLTEAGADDAAFFLSLFYRDRGYARAKVQWAIRGGNQLVLTISEGDFTRLGKVIFIGNHAKSAHQLLEALTGLAHPEGKRGAAIPFSQGEIQEGIARIRGLYLSDGFLNVIVDDPVITYSDNREVANVTVTIKEGTQYRFGPIHLQGEVVFFPKDELLNQLEVFTKAPYTPLAVTNIERKILFYYRARGYFEAKVTSESDPEKAKEGIVPVTFYIDSGRPYLFGKITQSGLRRLRPSFLEKRFASFEGQPYDPNKIDERYRSLISTGLFSNLKIEQVPQPDGKVDLHLEVEEAKAHEVGFSIGYGSLEGLILGASYVDRNLLGFGRPLNFNADIAQNLIRGEVAYTDPWIFDTNYVFRSRLYALTQNLFDYSKIELGLRSELSRKLGKNLEVSLFGLSRGVVTHSATIDPIEMGATEYIVNSIGTSLTLDYRDSVLNPTKGLILNLSNDLALNAFGSEFNFFRGTIRASYYLPLGKTLLAVGFRGGIIYPFGGTYLPIDERFFNGGSRSVRSYVERSLGPRDRYGNTIGGETFTTFNIEHIFPIFDDLKGAVFFDAGSVGRHINDGLGVTGYAIGAGLRYNLPIGPVRLDYGFNPVRGRNEPTGAWHLNFGFAF